MNIIEENSRQIDLKQRLMHEQSAEGGPWQFKELAVLLSRTDEMKRIQDYFNSINED